MNNTPSTPYEFYSSYHKDPINKLIHFLTIPLIIITTLNFVSTFNLSLSNQYLHINQFYFTADFLLTLFYVVYYFTWNKKIGFVMLIYCSLMCSISFFWRYFSTTWLLPNLITFIIAWIFQFAGHKFFEKNRPALLDSLSQAFLTAPAFSLDYVFPSLFNTYQEL